MTKNKILLTAKDTAIYSVSNILVKMSGLILIPLYTNNFSLATYGLLSFYELTYEVLQLISGLGIDNALSRWYYDKKCDYSAKTTVFNSAIVSLVSTLLVMSVGYFTIYHFSEYIFWSKQPFNLITWFMISSFTRIFIRQPLLIMRLQSKALQQTIINVIRITLVVAFSFVTISHMKLGLAGIFIADFIANILIIPYIIYYCIKNIEFNFQPKLIKEMLKFSLPLVSSWILTLIITMSDRYVIRWFGKMEDNGIYNLAYKISNIIRVIVVHSFTQAYIPIYYRHMQDKDSKHFQSRFPTYYAIASLFIALGLTTFGQEAIQIVAQSEDYWQAYKLLPYLVIGTVFAGFRQIFVLPLNKYKKTNIIAIASIGAGILNIILNISLVPFFSAIGAAIATGIVNLSVAIFYYKWVVKLDNIRYQEKAIIMLVLLVIILSTLSMYIADWQIIHRLVFKVMIILTFMGVVWKFFWNKEIWNTIRNQAK